MRGVYQNFFDVLRFRELVVFVFVEKKHDLVRIFQKIIDRNEMIYEFVGVSAYSREFKTEHSAVYSYAHGLFWGEGTAGWRGDDAC